MVEPNEASALFACAFLRQIALRACLSLSEEARCSVFNCFCSLCGRLLPEADADVAAILNIASSAIAQQRRCACKQAATEKIALHRTVRMLARQAHELVEDYHCSGSLSVWKKQELVGFATEAVDVLEALIAAVK
jgi:hypothetical protein